MSHKKRTKTHHAAGPIDQKLREQGYKPQSGQPDNAPETKNTNNESSAVKSNSSHAAERSSPPHGGRNK